MKKYYLIGRKDVSQTELIHAERKDIKMVSEGGDILSCSCAYDSIKELKDERSVPAFNCCICGGIIDAGYTIKKELLENKMCFFCNHFRAVEIKANNDKNRVIIDGSSYHISPDNTGGCFKGFGGQKFKIKRFDSDNVIICRNLWHQGDLPKEWKERIPNNAKFIK